MIRHTTNLNRDTIETIDYSTNISKETVEIFVQYHRPLDFDVENDVYVNFR